MESVLFGLAFLACPVGMGAMMWFMARGRRGKGKEEPSASLEGLRVFRAPGSQAFCAGLLRPRIYVSTGALRALGSDELGAVLA